MFARRLSLIIVFVLAAAGSACSAVPPMINYQGKLMQPSGAVVPDGNYSIRLAIYEAPTGGTPLWSETNASVQVKGGLFATMLGSVVNLPANIFDSPNRFFGVKVGNDAEMSPRQQIASVGFAVKAGAADVAATVPDGAITPEKIADGAVTAIKLADGSVTTPKIADGAVNAAQIAAGAVTGAKISGESWTAYTPVVSGSGVSVGNGLVYGRYIKYGNLVFVQIQFNFGSSSTFGSSLGVCFSLPYTAANRTINYTGAAYMTDSSAAIRYIGTALVAANEAVLRVVCQAHANFLKTDVPFTWGSGDNMECSVMYEAE